MINRLPHHHFWLLSLRGAISADQTEDEVVEIFSHLAPGHAASHSIRPLAAIAVLERLQFSDRFRVRGFGTHRDYLLPSSILNPRLSMQALKSQ